MTEISEEHLRLLERMGVARVRLLLASGQLPQPLFTDALTWLTEIEAAEDAAREAIDVAQRASMKTTRNASIIAAGAAAATLIVALLAWLFPIR